MRYPRFVVRAISKMTGYYYGPCPICNRKFSSWENKKNLFNHDTLWTHSTGPGTSGLSVCPKCVGCPRVLWSEMKYDLATEKSFPDNWKILV